MTAPVSRIDAISYPMLSLEEWRDLLGFHPFHFWQLANSSIPITSSCNTLVHQYAWQASDRVGRSEIEKAIISAEERLRFYLGYSPTPHYVMETLPFPHFYDRQFDMHGHWGADARWRTIRASEGYIEAMGVENLTSILQGAVITYSDEDGDGINDTFQVSAPTTLTNENEIAVYFSSADRFTFDQSLSDRWRIRPIYVTFSAGNVIIRGRSYQLVRPVLYEGLASETLDPTVITNFATTLDIYRRYTSAGITQDTAQAILIWESAPSDYWSLPCCTYYDDPAGEYYSYARVGLHDKRLGILDIAEAVYDPTSQTWKATCDCLEHCRPPDRVILRYKAGYPTDKGRMSSVLNTIVARMAAAELARPICACEAANRELYHWQFDLSRAAGANDEQYTVSGDALTNPFGTRRGQVYAWRQIMAMRQERGYAP